MTRFGKIFVGVLLILAIGFASMLRWAPKIADPHPDAAAGRASTPPPKPIRDDAAMIVPVAGVRPSDLYDSFGDARSGHVHGALDIPAERGRPVVAAAAGRVEKIFESVAGGHTVYIRSPDGRLCFYYAHLDRYAPGLMTGLPVARGQAIGTVGSSGDAAPSGPHLHFEVKAMAPGDRWYKGRALNPYPLLTRAPA